MSRRFLFSFLLLSLLSSSLLFVFGLTCQQEGTYNCLVLQVSCHFNYSYTPPICDTGPPTDGCGSISNPSTCQSTPSCLFDEYLNYCFVDVIQPISIFPCADWPSLVYIGDLPQACAFHDCFFNSTLQTCDDVLVAPVEVVNSMNGISYAPTFSTPYSISFADQNELMRLSITLQLSLPLNFVNFTWYTMVVGWPDTLIGTTNNQTLLASMTGPCGTATQQPITIPNYLYPLPGPPIVLPNGETSSTMYTYLVNWIATTGTLVFSTSDPRGIALSSYFGTGLTNHLVSATVLNSTAGTIQLDYTFPWHSVCLLDTNNNIIAYDPTLSQAVITVNWFSQQSFNTWSLWQSSFLLTNQVDPDSFFTIASNWNLIDTVTITLIDTFDNTSSPCASTGTQGSVAMVYTIEYDGDFQDQIAPSLTLTATDLVNCYGDQLISVETTCQIDPVSSSTSSIPPSSSSSIGAASSSSSSSSGRIFYTDFIPNLYFAASLVQLSPTATRALRIDVGGGSAVDIGFYPNGTLNVSDYLTGPYNVITVYNQVSDGLALHVGDLLCQDNTVTQFYPVGNSDSNYNPYIVTNGGYNGQCAFNNSFDMTIDSAFLNWVTNSHYNPAQTNTIWQGDSNFILDTNMVTIEFVQSGQGGNSIEAYNQLTGLHSTSVSLSTTPAHNILYQNGFSGVMFNFTGDVINPPFSVQTWCYFCLDEQVVQIVLGQASTQINIELAMQLDITNFSL